MLLLRTHWMLNWLLVLRRGNVDSRCPLLCDLFLCVGGSTATPCDAWAGGPAHTLGSMVAAAAVAASVGGILNGHMRRQLLPGNVCGAAHECSAK